MTYRTAGLIGSLAFAVVACQDRLTAPQMAVPTTASLETTSPNSTWINGTMNVDYYSYIDCLGETAHLFGSFPYSEHFVTSGSGNYVAHLQFAPQTPHFTPFQIVGLTSGKVFVYQNGGPFNRLMHVNSGEIINVVDNESYKAADGSTLKFTARIHVTVNANGVVTISRDAEGFVCG